MQFGDRRQSDAERRYGSWPKAGAGTCGRAMTSFLKSGTQLPRGTHCEVGFGFDKVKAEATGRWPAILRCLGVPAECLQRRAGPCPGCGGKDRFRFDDKGGSGSWFCNGAGTPQSGDGFDLLVHALGLTKGEALRAVAEHLGLKSTTTNTETYEASQARELRKIEEALVHELLVILQIIQARVSSRQLATDSRFRVLRPEWTPMPEGYWERELLAVRRIRNGLKAIYG